MRLDIYVNFRGTCEEAFRFYEKELGAKVGIGVGAVISTWNLIGMYTTIPVATWDVVRQVLFLAALAGIVAVAARAARAGGSWGITGLLATVAAVGCAATVLGTYAVSTLLGTDRIRQVPEFIRDYTNNGHTSPATYFADHYWALLQLQTFTWVIAVAGMAAVGTVLGRAAENIGSRRAAEPLSALRSASTQDVSVRSSSQEDARP